MVHILSLDGGLSRTIHCAADLSTTLNPKPVEINGEANE